MGRRATGSAGKDLRPRRVMYRPRVEAVERRVLLAAILVTNTADTGAGSLRAAITAADAATGPQVIDFNIPTTDPGFNASTGVWTISPASGLPAITNAVTIDGYSQPGASVNTMAVGDNAILKVVLDGTNAGANTDGLLIQGSGGSTVQGLVIDNFAGNGIHVRSNNDRILGDFIGIDAAGNTARNNQGNGVNIDGSANSTLSGTQVGGSSPAQRDIISGNVQQGVFAGFMTASTGNTIAGDYIGTNAAGISAVPNGNGTATNPGPLSGILVLNSVNTVIGGSTAGAGNLVSANAGGQIDVTGASSTGNRLQGNLIGTDANGNRPTFANPANQSAVFVNGSNNLIGGPAAGDGNTIAYNVGNGVGIQTGTGNAVLGNAIFTNVASGIALTLGGNNNQAAPFLTSAVTAGGTTTFTGTITGSGTAPYTIQFFASPSATIGQGQQFLGQTIVSANGSFTATLPTPSLVGNVFTATATDAGNNTSPFSFAFPNVVTNTNDSGPGSLRQAILNVNAGGIATAPGIVQTITFAIPGAGVHTISPASPLPAINNPVFIDGYSQPGSSANTLAQGDNAVLNIVLDGTGAGATADGLDINSGGSTVEGLVIDNFGSNGIMLVSSNNIISGNFIGIDATGTTARGNKNIGVNINASSNTVGGTQPADRNVISANAGAGIFSGASGIGGNDTFENNYVGTNAAGTAKLGNFIGLNLINGVSGNTIGIAGAGNLISGNTLDGIELNGNGAVEHNNTIQGNLVGTDATGTNPIPNGGNGVAISAGAINNTIGGLASGVGNTIAFNGADGVFVSGGAGNSILSNSIFSNGSVVPTGQGISLGQNGNNQQDFPVLTTSMFTSPPNPGGFRDIIGALQASANTTYTIQFFASPAPSPTGFGEGKTLVGQFNVTTGPTGLAAINFGLSPFVGANQVITSTATDPTGNTSQFSQVSADLSVTGVAKPIGLGQEGDLLSFVFNVDNNGPSPAVGAKLAASIPPGTSFVSASIGTTPVNVSPVNGVVTIPLGALVRGSSTTVSVVVMINTTAPLSTTATVSSSTADLVTGNNTVTVNYGTPNVFTVTTAADNGDNANPVLHSLRQAIKLVNADTFNTTPDSIVFDIGAGTQTIQPMSNPLPALTHAVLIDGTASSQFPTQLIELDGTHAGLNTNGLVISGGNSIIRRLTINRFGGSAIVLNTKGNDIVESDFIGTDVTGNAPLGNTLDGVDIEGTSGNMIGLPGAGNIIAANEVGVYIYDGATSNAVMANLLGGVAPNSPLGNRSGGVLIAGSNGNLVGGMSQDQGNVIAGNPAYSGVVLFNGATRNTVAFNTIVDNGNSGVYILDSPGNRIGAAGAPNNIVGNSFAGVDIARAASTSNSVQYNQIARNAHDGVYIFGASNNVIGGPGGAGNNIVGSGFSGVHIDGAGATGNVVQGNTITGSIGYGVLIDDAIQNIIGGSGDASNTILNNAFGSIQVLNGGLPASTPAGGNIILSNNTVAPAVVVGTTASSHAKRTKLHPTAHVIQTHPKTVVKIHTKALPTGPVRSFAKVGRVASKSVSKTR